VLEWPAAYSDEAGFAEDLARHLDRFTGRKLPVGHYDAKFFWHGGAHPYAAVTARRSSQMALCVDSTPLVCMRSDGFSPRVREGRCQDPRCEVLARGEDEVRAFIQSFEDRYVPDGYLAQKVVTKPGWKSKT
jgi:hypothetical protein